MKTKTLSRKEKMLARIQEFTLMDDDFMTRFFENEPACTEFLLQTILGKKNLKVIESVSQKVVKSLEGRSVRLDVFARDDSGRMYDIEIQRTDKGAGAKRARYNSALIDADESQPGVEPDMLPETYVIFITENDIYKQDLPLYHIERMILECEKSFNDGTHIIYVNGGYRGNDPVGKLMHDFHCKKAGDMKNKILANRVRQLKEKEKGEKQMSRIMEEFAKEERADKELEMCVKLLESGKMSESEIIELFNLTEEQIKAIHERMAVPV